MVRDPIPSAGEFHDPEHRARLQAEARALGITPAFIAELVAAFYARVRRDPLIGPVFETAITGDWDPHLQRMARFWESVMLHAGSYQGRPRQTHARLPDLTHAHFLRWLELFDETLAALGTSPEAAARFRARARMMARALGPAA